MKFWHKIDLANYQSNKAFFTVSLTHTHTHTHTHQQDVSCLSQYLIHFMWFPQNHSTPLFYLRVLVHPVLLGGLWDTHHPALQVPADKHLSWGLRVYSSNLLNLGIIKNLSIT